MSSTCPICRSGSLLSLPHHAKDYISNKSFLLKECSLCQCVITTGAASSSFDDSYGDAYYNSSKGKFSPFFEKIFRWNHKRNAKLLNDKLHPQSVLEIGCGRAYLLKELKALGVNVFALESSSAAEWILDNETVTIVKMPEESSDWPFPPSSFQLVIYWHVLEHLLDPVASLQQAEKVLEKDGILCVSVPNISSYQARMRLTSWFHLDVPRHLFHFSKNGVIQLLEQNGFEIVNVRSGDLIQNLYGWFQSLANLFTPQDLNGFYRLLQGGKPLNKASRTTVAVQLVTAWFWVPLGIIGWLVETITGNHGTITIYAKKIGNEK